MESGPEPAHSESLFFAIKPSPQACEEISSVVHSLALDSGLRGKMFDAATLHISLCEIGRAKKLRQPHHAAVAASGDMVRCPAFDVELDRAIGFNVGTLGYPNVLLASDSSRSALLGLRMAIVDAQRHHGLFASRASSFTPHVTVSRSGTHWRFNGQIPTVRWSVMEFLLIHSHHDGAVRRHDVVGRWPLLSVP